MKKNIDLNKKAQEILDIAQTYGVEQNFFFMTTFKRYQVQINILTELEKQFKTDGTIVTKEYVKGRENIYTHPAVKEYNNTSTAANQTVTTLMKIITTLKDTGEESNALIEFITRR